MIKLTDRIYYLPSEAETDRPVLGYVKGENYSIMIDAGNSLEHVKRFNKELKNLGLPSPYYTVLTHWHWDHTFGMHSLSSRTIAGHLTNKKLKEVKAWEWSDEAMLKRLKSGEDIDFCDKHIRLEYPNRSEIKVVSAEIEFNNELVLDLGGVHCIIKSIEAPHSEDSVIIYVKEERVLFVGDAECEDFYNNGFYDKIKLYNYIKLLENLDFETYVLGHAKPQPKQEAIAFLKGELAKL